jgi:hypothetical protein
MKRHARLRIPGEYWIYAMAAVTVAMAVIVHYLR